MPFVLLQAWRKRNNTIHFDAFGASHPINRARLNRRSRMLFNQILVEERLGTTGILEFDIRDRGLVTTSRIRISLYVLKVRSIRKYKFRQTLGTSRGHEVPPLDELRGSKEAKRLRSASMSSFVFWNANQQKSVSFSNSIERSWAAHQNMSLPQKQTSMCWDPVGLRQRVQSVGRALCQATWKLRRDWHSHKRRYVWKKNGEQHLSWDQHSHLSLHRKKISSEHRVSKQVCVTWQHWQPALQEVSLRATFSVFSHRRHHCVWCWRWCNRLGGRFAQVEGIGNRINIRSHRNKRKHSRGASFVHTAKCGISQCTPPRTPCIYN